MSSRFLASLCCLLLAAPALAAPYASGIRNTTGTTYEFVLNEAADNVTVNFDVGGSLDLGALAKGRHTFDLGAASNYDIVVSRNAAPGYVLFDESTPGNENLFTSFDRPGGLQINTIPSSPYFGTIYVNQNRSASGFDPITQQPIPVVTGDGRTMGNGIYSLTADRMGVDLTNFSAVANANDPGLAKTGGVVIDEVSSSSFYRIGMDEAGNIIAGDWTNNVGGLKYVSADLTTGYELFDTSGLGNPLRDAGGVVQSDSNGVFTMFGSVNGEPQVSGSVGNGLVVRAMDEDLDRDFIKTGATDGNNVWSWDFGNATGPAIVRPELISSVGELYTSTGQPAATSGVSFPGDLSGNPAGTHSDASTVFLDSNIGVTANGQYNAHFDKWYLSGSRSNGDDSSSLVIFTPEGPGGDGRDIQVDWASKQFTIDNGLDGFANDENVELSLDPNNDIFRNVHNVAFSPDNTIMFVQRRIVTADNPVLGTDTDLGTKILAIPLDENGLPDIVIDDNETPGDTSDDILTNVIAIDAGIAGAIGSLSNVKTDAAGNLYYSGNQIEKLQYFSLGGNTVATTSSSGTFDIVTIEALTGDYNADGVVDAADYTVWRDSLGDSVTAGTGADGNGNGFIDGPQLGPGNDYEIWANNYGSGVASTSAAVPEPSTAALLGVLVASIARRW